MSEIWLFAKNALCSALGAVAFDDRERSCVLVESALDGRPRLPLVVPER